jgi:type II secretory pathway component PulF
MRHNHQWQSRTKAVEREHVAMRQAADRFSQGALDDPSILQGNLLGAMLATPQTVAETQDVLHFLCRYYDGKFSRAATLLRGAIIPATAIGFGIVVCLIALGIFQPLVAVINKLTGQ